MKMASGALQIIKKWSGLAALVVLVLCIFCIPTVAQDELDEEQPEPCPKPYIKIISPRAAQPLTEVKIRGSRFGSELGSVTFTPGVAGKVVSWTNRRIFVEVPEDAQTGPVTVAASCGSVSNDQYFTVDIKEEEEVY